MQIIMHFNAITFDANTSLLVNEWQQHSHEKREIWYIRIWLSLLESTAVEHNKTPHKKICEKKVLHFMIMWRDTKEEEEDNLAVKGGICTFFDIFIVIISHHCHYHIVNSTWKSCELSELVESFVIEAAKAVKSTSIPPNGNQIRKFVICCTIRLYSIVPTLSRFAT